MKRIQNLRNKIKARTAELGIATDHDNTGHYYKYNGQRYESVTRKLSIVKDQALMLWQKNRALAHIRNNWLEGKDYKNEDIERIIQEAKDAPILEFTGAGDIGKTVHDWREGWFQEWIERNPTIVEYLGPYPSNDPRPEVKSSCEAIKRCIVDLQAQPLACELSLVDDKLKLGGMLDDVWAVPKTELINVSDTSGMPEPLKRGKKIKTTWETWLVDLKTSNIGNKDSYYMQVALYWHMFRTLYKIKIDKLFILHTSKTRFGEYELIPLKYPKKYLQMAKNALKLYDDLQELKELKKLEVAKIKYEPTK